MKQPCFALLSVVAALALPAAAQTGSTAGKPPSAVAKTTRRWTPPRTPDGQPDLQGLWNNATITPLERPQDLAGKPFFTEQEATGYEQQRIERSKKVGSIRAGREPQIRRDGAAEPNLEPPGVEPADRDDFDAWEDTVTKVVKTLRTSMVIDPPDGRVPALTPAAENAQRARIEAARKPPAGPEDLPLDYRCIHRSAAGPPMLPSLNNNNYRIFQTREYVAILVEMIHDVRLIPLDGRPHLPQDVRLLLGDSRGHWEGSTLVVDTTNFTDETHFRGADRNLHLIERFTRTDADTIIYSFTVDDPTAFTRPWTAELPMIKSEGPIYEYACHEGNYSVLYALTGARAQERQEAAKTGSK